MLKLQRSLISLFPQFLPKLRDLSKRRFSNCDQIQRRLGVQDLSDLGLDQSLASDELLPGAPAAPPQSPVRVFPPPWNMASATRAASTFALLGFSSRQPF
jgi:hypothetical protein